MKFQFTQILGPLGIALAVLTSSHGKDNKFNSNVLDSQCERQWLQERLPSAATCTIVSAQLLQQGQDFGQGAEDVAYPLPATNLPQVCAIIANVTSSATSSFSFGLLLPISKWNGRFLAVGNAGYNGGIDWPSMGNAVRRHQFAAMSTDTGHSSSALDGSWAYHAPEKVIDWAHRAMHGSTVLGKALVEAFYGEAAHHSYFSGCSIGGRQGLRAAQLYPEDYDGIIASSPAWWITHLPLWTVRSAALNLPNTSAGHIPLGLLSNITAHVLAQCDEIDGVKDGVLSEPLKCKVDTNALLCNSSDPAGAKGCLSQAQVKTLDSLYTDYKDKNGTFIFPAASPGSEEDWAYSIGALDGQPASLGMDYIKYMLGNVNFTYSDLNDGIIQQSEQANPGNATADGYDMSVFKNRGGKLLMTHGWADGLVSGRSAITFYDFVVQAMPNDMQRNSWFQLYMIPGLQHCSGSSPTMKAPWYFAGPLQALNPAPGGSTDATSFKDANHDIHLAAVDWVEQGKAPRLFATSFFNDTAIPGRVVGKRPMCPYPQVAKYRHAGRGAQYGISNSWECAIP